MGSVGSMLDMEMQHSRVEGTVSTHKFHSLSFCLSLIMVWAVPWSLIREKLYLIFGHNWVFKIATQTLSFLHHSPSIPLLIRPWQLLLLMPSHLIQTLIGMQINSQLALFIQSSIAPVCHLTLLWNQLQVRVTLPGSRRIIMAQTLFIILHSSLVSLLLTLSHIFSCLQIIWIWGHVLLRLIVSHKSSDTSLQGCNSGGWSKRRMTAS